MMRIVTSAVVCPTGKACCTLRGCAASRRRVSAKRKPARRENACIFHQCAFESYTWALVSVLLLANSVKPKLQAPSLPYMNNIRMDQRVNYNARLSPLWSPASEEEPQAFVTIDDFRYRVTTFQESCETIAFALATRPSHDCNSGKLAARSAVYICQFPNSCAQQYLVYHLSFVCTLCCVSRPARRK